MMPGRAVGDARADFDGEMINLLDFQLDMGAISAVSRYKITIAS